MDQPCLVGLQGAGSVGRDLWSLPPLRVALGVLDKASNALGGGIGLWGTNLTINGDVLIKCNGAQNGSGLCIQGGKTATITKARFEKNEVSSNGGAYVDGVFDFHEGIIGRDENGNAKSNTKTTGKGSGVYVASSASQFIMDTDCCVDVNNDIYLPASARICIFDHFTQFKSNPPPGIITRPSYTTDTEIFAMGPDFDDIEIGWQGCENFQVTDSNYEIKMVSGTYNITHK